MDNKEQHNILMQRYEVGRLLGQGTFAKVHYARDLKTGQSVAIKIVDKDKVLRVGLDKQIKREITAMRLIAHPNVVQLYEVMATRSKIYFVMEYVRGGELFNKLSKGRLKEDVARRYFHQLILAVDFCHSRGVYHRDLKPENLLLDEFGNLKVTDFGLSALVDSKRHDDLLHTTCGTPAYVAPEVINKRGYDGEKSDIWSCGVILFVLLAGYLPFNDSNLIVLYGKIRRGEFKCPHWFPSDVRKLLLKILDPNPITRITASRIMDNTWFRKIQTKRIKDEDNDDVTPRSVLEITKFDYDSPKKKNVEHEEEEEEEDEWQASSCSTEPNRTMNAFDLISKSPGFDLSRLFEKESNRWKRHETWFTTRMAPSEVVCKLEEAAARSTERFRVEKKEGGRVVRMEGREMGRKGKIEVEAKIMEVAAASFHFVEVKKTGGDTLEYIKFREQELKPCLKDVVWRWQEQDSLDHSQPGLDHPSSTE